MKKRVFLYGFSIFSMFFGSGNLVFPLMVGVDSYDNWLAGFLGFFCTGIILPFLGLFVIKLHRGSYKSFFGEAGSIAKFIIPLFTLSLLGAFGVIPRCIAVAHGGLEFLFEDISLMLFSSIFCFSCYIICLNESWMFSIVGKFLTPLLLLFLMILIIAGIYESPSISLISSSIESNFLDGFFQGYATMDLFAAFFFSSLIFKQIEMLVDESKGESVIKAALAPSLFGATLLGIIYFGFVYLGAHYHHLAQDLPGELILPAIAKHLLGKNGALFIAIIIILSCLTTAVALNSIYAEYLRTLKPFKSISFRVVLLVTTLLSFTVSLLDFDGIALILSPLLAISYPGLIALTIMSICIRGRRSLKMISFYSIIAIMLIV